VAAPDQPRSGANAAGGGGTRVRSRQIDRGRIPPYRVDNDPTLAEMQARCPQRGRNSRRGVVTRAAGEGPRGAGIDGHCESAHEADARCNDSPRRSKEAEALRREWTAT